MNIIKRSGAEVTFDADKIQNAVEKANGTVEEAERLSNYQIEEIVRKVTTRQGVQKRSAERYQRGGYPADYGVRSSEHQGRDAGDACGRRHGRYDVSRFMIS